jgi:hypothetical protein
MNFSGELRIESQNISYVNALVLCVAFSSVFLCSLSVLNYKLRIMQNHEPDYPIHY